MNDEKIILPDFIIADIYKNHLIEPGKDANEEVTVKSEPKRKIQKADDAKKTSLPYLGENKKGIVVLISEAAATFINDEELTFLTKILNACNLNIADIAIINTANTKVLFEQLTSELKAEYILLLGVAPASIQLPFTVPDFQVQQFSNCIILSSPALSSMLTNTAESMSYKKQLWASLQKAFNLI
jgi:hypothetical protein